MRLDQVSVRPILKQEELKYVQLMEMHHYLGGIPKTGETFWYVATYDVQWIALISFSAAALKCVARDQWIGWSYRHQTGRLKLIANNRVRVEPHELEAAFSAWNKVYVQDDESLAIDGKVMCNALDERGRQTQIMSEVGHTAGICYAQKK